LSTSLGRRRFIAISAAAGASAWALAQSGPAATAPAVPHRWRGIALGAQASLLLHHPDKAAAQRLIQACVGEIERLENIFSLYREGSAVARLNRAGRLDQPPLELVRALADCRRLGDLTNGAFDVSVQPLWRLYARHFGAADTLVGPANSEIREVGKLIDYRNISIGASHIEFEKPGMAITLNGFAQGFITDRIAELLRAKGLRNVLLDIGETRALDDHPEGRPWRVGIRMPGSDAVLARKLSIEDQAVATSGGYGQTFDASGDYHHLFDPKSGKSGGRYASVTVVAPEAATADGLSTALSVLPVTAAEACLRKAGAAAVHYLHHDGSFETVRI